MTEQTRLKIETALNNACAKIRSEQGELSLEQICLVTDFCEKLDCDMHVILKVDEIDQIDPPVGLEG